MQRWSAHLAICLHQTRQFGARVLLAFAALFIQSAVNATEVVDGQETQVQIEAKEAITRSAPIRRRGRTSKLWQISGSGNSRIHGSASPYSICQRRLDVTKDMRRLLGGGNHSNRNGLGGALLI